MHTRRTRQAKELAREYGQYVFKIINLNNAYQQAILQTCTLYLLTECILGSIQQTVVQTYLYNLEGTLLRDSFLHTCTDSISRCSFGFFLLLKIKNKAQLKYIQKVLKIMKKCAFCFQTQKINTKACMLVCINYVNIYFE